MKRVWKQLSEIGWREDMSHGQVKRLRMVNRVSAFAIIAFLLLTLRYVNAGQINGAIYQSFSVVGMVTVLVLNRYRFFNVARYIFLATHNLNSVLSTSAMGFEGGEHLGFIVLLMFIPLIYDVQREKTGLRIGLLMTICTITWVFVSDFQALPFRGVTTSPEVLHEGHISNLIVTMVIAVILAVNYQRFSQNEVETIVERGRRQLQAAFDRSYNGTMLLDTVSFNILECNRRMKELFLLKEDVLVGTLLDHCNLPHLNSIGLRQLISELGDAGRASREYFFRLPSGKTFWGQMDVTYFAYEDKQQLLVQVRDITQIKEHEQEITLAKERAESANIAKAHFLDNMSHEFRTPVNGINGIAEIIQAEYPQNDDLQQYADLLLVSGNRLLRTMDLVINLSHLESGKVDFAFQPENVYDLISGTLADMETEIEATTVPIRLPVADAPLFIQADTELFQQALAHLLSNGLKFTRQGEVSVKVLLRENERQQPLVSVCVEDTGVGMSEKFVEEKLFMKFEQESQGLDRDYEGAGLGLSVTKRIVEILGGTIHVWSSLGTGSSFEMRFPLHITSPNISSPIHTRQSSHSV